MTAYIPWSQAGVGTLCHKWEGSIQSLSLQGFQVAYVVFQKPSGVSAALNLKGPLLVSTESHLVKSGIHSQYCWLCPVLLPQALGWSRHFLGAASMNATSCAPLFLKAWAGRGYF